jgi:hypothetical protein
MIKNIFKNRVWQLKFSFLKRRCYITNKPLRFIWCYRGRKLISSSINRREIVKDDLWICQQEYLRRLSRNEI